MSQLVMSCTSLRPVSSICLIRIFPIPLSLSLFQHLDANEIAAYAREIEAEREASETAKKKSGSSAVAAAAATAAAAVQASSAAAPQQPGN